MSDDIDTEIQRAERNARKLRALQAENERASEQVASIRAALVPRHDPTASPTPTPPRPAYAVRG